MKERLFVRFFGRLELKRGSAGPLLKQARVFRDFMTEFVNNVQIFLSW